MSVSRPSARGASRHAGAGQGRDLLLLFLGQQFLDLPAPGFILRLTQQFPVALDVLAPEESLHAPYSYATAKPAWECAAGGALAAVSAVTKWALAFGPPRSPWI